MLYTIVVLRASVCGNLSEKKESWTHWCLSSVSATFRRRWWWPRSWSPSPMYCMWLSTSIWKDPSQSDYRYWLLRGSLGLWWRERYKKKKNQVIPKQKKGFFSPIIKASLIKCNKKFVVPTSQSQNNKSSTFLYTEKFSYVLEVKSLAVLCTADHWRFVHEAVRYLGGTTDRLERLCWMPPWATTPVPHIGLSSGVLKQQCPSYPPQIAWSGEERGVSCPRHRYVPVPVTDMYHGHT